MNKHRDRSIFKSGKHVATLALLTLVTGFGMPAAHAEEYTIQPDDVLSIRVDGEPGLSRNYTVDERGDITLDVAGKIHVAGLTSMQSQERLTKEVAKYLKVFELKVALVGEIGNRVLVFGEVAKPGSIKVRVGGKLLDVLAEAGQPTPNADTKRITVAHKAGGASQEVDLDNVLRNPTMNVAILAGDTITVPPKSVRSVRVDGEVSKPGPRPLDEAKTAYAAVQSAGPSANIDWKRVALRRKGSNIPLLIDLSAVRSGQLKDDLELQEGDQLTVMSKFSGTATIRGEVRTPGEKDLNGPTQLWDFLLKEAGGFTDKADRTRVQIIRPGQTMRTIDFIKVANGVIRTDDPQLAIQGGDTIFVPMGVAQLSGAVKTAGDHPLGTVTSVRDFIAGGGGLADNADTTHVELRRDGKLVKVINLTDVHAGSPDDPETMLRPGDVVMVPTNEKNLFAIVGGVKKPGTFPVKPGMTLLDAVAAADGFTEKATHKQFVVAPAALYGPDGKPKQPLVGPADKKGKSKGADPSALNGMIVVDYKLLLKGDPKQNVAINPGDRILIPEDIVNPNQRHKPSFLQSIMQMVPLAGMFMTGGAGYYGGGFGYPYGGY